MSVGTTYFTIVTVTGIGLGGIGAESTVTSGTARYALTTITDVTEFAITGVTASWLAGFGG